MVSLWCEFSSLKVCLLREVTTSNTVYSRHARYMASYKTVQSRSIIWSRFHGFLIFFIDLSFDQPTEDPNSVLRHHRLASPVILEEENCLLSCALEPRQWWTLPERTFIRDSSTNVPDGTLLCPTPDVPKCVSTVLSVVQTELLHDAVHEGDASQELGEYLAEWKDYRNQWVMSALCCSEPVLLCLGPVFGGSVDLLACVFCNCKVVLKVNTYLKWFCSKESLLLWFVLKRLLILTLSRTTTGPRTKM